MSIFLGRNPQLGPVSSESGAASPTVVLYQQLVAAGWTSVANTGDTTAWNALYFEPSVTGLMVQLGIILRLSSGGDTHAGVINFLLKNDSAGTPGATIASNSFNVSNITNTVDNGLSAVTNMLFASSLITSGTKYWIVFDPTGYTGTGDISSAFKFNVDVTAGSSASTDSGATWTDADTSDRTISVLALGAAGLPSTVGGTSLGGFGF